MKRASLVLLMLVACSHHGWGIYGPTLERADVELALHACQEANFRHGAEIVRAMRGGQPDDILQVLGGAMTEWRSTPATSADYPAKAFCIHELVPARLQPGGSQASPTRLEPTLTVRRFKDLGIEYFYYDPDDEWTLKNDPVDLEKLARNTRTPNGDAKPSS